MSTPDIASDVIQFKKSMDDSETILNCSKCGVRCFELALVCAKRPRTRHPGRHMHFVNSKGDSSSDEHQHFSSSHQEKSNFLLLLFQSFFYLCKVNKDKSMGKSMEKGHQKSPFSPNVKKEEKGHQRHLTRCWNIKPLDSLILVTGHLDYFERIA